MLKLFMYVLLVTRVHKGKTFIYLLFIVFISSTVDEIVKAIAYTVNDNITLTFATIINNKYVICEIMKINMIG